MNPIAAMTDAFHQAAAAASHAGEGAAGVATDIINTAAGHAEALACKAAPVVERIADAAIDVARDPLGFYHDLLKATGRGFGEFAGNLGTHLKEGVIEWAAGHTGIDVPSELSLRSLIGVGTDVLEMTWDRVSQKTARVVGTEAPQIAKHAAEIAVDLLKNGPADLWRELRG